MTFRLDDPGDSSSTARRAPGPAVALAVCAGAVRHDRGTTLRGTGSCEPVAPSLEAAAGAVASIEEQLSGACTTEIAAFDEFAALIAGEGCAQE